MADNVPNVKISLQSASETKIQEISFDGRERFIQPLSMSESLTDLANRIDFLAEESDSTNDDLGSEESQPQQRQWPWENIHMQVQKALIEMSVLGDVLSIAQNKPLGVPRETTEASDANRYMMFDLATKDVEPSKMPLQMITKKRCLGAAAKILLAGADRLSKAKSESSFQNSFHHELLKLRQRWRLRRVGEKILGELSYKTAGSDFWHSGYFEVIKKSEADKEEIDDDEKGLMAMNAKTPKSPIKVVIGSDLRGFSSISVTISKKVKGQPKFEAQLSYSDVINSTAVGVNEPLWHQKLCNAQNVLFCRELFARMSKEAVQQKATGTTSPVVVVGDKITTSIFPDTDLCVQLLYSKTLPKPAQQKESADKSKSAVFSIKHALANLLLHYFSKRLNVTPPHPTIANLGPTNEMRLAAVQHNGLKQLTKSAERNSISFIESLIQMAKHYEVRRRLSQVIKSVSHQFRDPDIQAHWSLASSMRESSIRITIVNFGFDSCYRSAVQLVAKPDCVKVLQKEARCLELSPDPTEIYDYFVSLVASHQLLTIQFLSRTLGWSMLHFTPHSSLGMSPRIKNRGSIILSSPLSGSNVGIVCSETHDKCIEYEVHIQYSKLHDEVEPMAVDQQADFEDINSLNSRKYLPLGGAWKQVDWPNLHGRHFIQKIETLLTSLAY